MRRTRLPQEAGNSPAKRGKCRVSDKRGAPHKSRLRTEKGDRLRWKRTILIICSPCFKSRVLSISVFILSRLLLVSLVKATSPMRRTHPLRQPLADTSPNSMGEFAPSWGKLVFDCVRSAYFLLLFMAKTRL